jgi:hypothetical protein
MPPTFTISVALTASTLQKKPLFDFALERMIRFGLLTSTASPHSFLMKVAYGTRIRPKQRIAHIVFVICSLLTTTLAATDCEILSSGIPSISSTACCTETAGITCIGGRVTEMYKLVPYLILE